MNNIGIYVHVPFCESKCPYCDFYSVRYDNSQVKNYISSVLRSMEKYRGLSADTLYFGGGTPSVLGGHNLSEMIKKNREIFNFVSPEITVECNPSSCTPDLFEKLASVGVNRISLGLQSANDDERRKLGRLSDSNKVRQAILDAKKNGIENISLDLMLGIENQTEDSLKKSVEFCLENEVKHISAYILKIEDSTHFGKIRDKLNLPDEDETCDLYMTACELIEAGGLYQYEISNFAQKGFESRHNLKYWNCEEYLGFGPSAHSFHDGKRFYFDRKFEDNPVAIPDGDGGDLSEFFMLKLRLSQGISEDEILKKYNRSFSDSFMKKARQFESYSLLKIKDKTISLTKEGFLVSNTIISELEVLL
ncbi:MAG: radical SAM family heme chaperone HemW [Clostridia bacterium]|nr:radical SAM family heme chaperone HemW [Clostridia bacterium]